MKVPRTIEDALDDDNPYKEQWSAAIQKEYKNLLDRGTWILDELPNGRKPIGCRWVFTVPSDNDGKVKKFKARLVIQGFSQRAGIDYDKTFAPVARQESLRMLLAIAAERQMSIRQVDIVSAYLNGKLREIFMKQPPGFTSSSKPNYVCRLKKALYGLKQAERVWNETFNQFMVVESNFQKTCILPLCVYQVRRRKVDHYRPICRRSANHS